ncbi:MAG TPA: DNA repair protein RecN [Vicinamibacteria bacterium]|nr:DNA repair protein RecN [Vicinamibacteria bacterium]
MLRWIRVQNVAVIERLEIDFEPGLNLLTGETGAGKSILIDALGLVLGSRATSDIIRTGSDRAIVEASFEVTSVPEALRCRLDDAGVEVDDEVVVRRELTATGRGKIAVNGVAAPRQLLRDLAPFLADIHGQGENSSLLTPGAGLELLDRFGGMEVLAESVRESSREVKRLEEEIEDSERSAKERELRRRELVHELSELDGALLRGDEDEELAAERKLVSHAEKLKTFADEVYADLYDEEGAAIPRLARVWSRVESLGEIDPRWKPYSAERAAIMSQLEDLAFYARDYAQEIDVTPGRLDEIEARLSILERIKRKYGGDLASAISRRDSARAELEAIDSSDDRRDQIVEKLERARARYREMAKELARMRRNAAKELERAVMKELPSLALPKARFVLELQTDETSWSETGLDRVEMLFSGNAGEEPRPLARTASGGELSRFMLALKSVAAKDASSKTLVFDEVDAGIGGRVADAVGEKLLELSATHQVICVTHLPQIASFAPAHYRIAKIERKGRTETEVTRLDMDGRVGELARMMAGAVVTESAREHARQLLNRKKANVRV